MGKKNRFIKILSVSLVIASSHATIAAAEETSNTSSNNYYLADVSRSVWSIRQIAQAQLPSPENASPEIIQPAQQPIPSIEPLNPSGNPLSFPTQAEEVDVDIQKPITLEQAIELVLRNNKDIEVARLQVERAEAELRQQRAALYPTLDLTSQLTYGNDLFLDSITEQNIDQLAEESVADDPNLTEEAARQQAEDRFTDISSNSFDFRASLGISYDIYDGGQRGASIRAARKQLRSAELNLESTVEQNRFEASRDYYDLQNNDAQVEIQEAAVEDALQTLKDAQLLERAGLGTRFDVLLAEVELAQARQRVTTAIANQNIARRQLAETLSVDHSTELSTADAIEEAGTWNLELAQTIVQAFKNRAELEQQLLEREINQEQRTIQLAATRPRLTANANYTTDDDFEDEFDISDRYSVGLSLEWSLFDGGAARAGADQAEIDAEIDETEFADLRNQIRFQVEQAFFQLRSNQDNIDTATREVELAEESLRLARLRFQAGVGTQSDVIDAQTQLTQARGSLVSSIIDYNQSFVQLQREVSNTPDNGLQDLP